MNSFKRARYRVGATVKTAAAAAGVSPDAIYGYERGARTPDAPTAKALADFYETTVDELLGFAEPDQEAA